MLTTFVLLGLTICAVWLPPIQLAQKKISPWILLFFCALCSGLVQGFLAPIAIVELGILIICTAFSQNSVTSKLQRTIFSLITAVGALALAMHLLPGFNNPILMKDFRFTADAAPYTQYLNFDKSAVGLILLVFLCARTNTVAEWSAVLRRTIPIAMATTVLVLSIGVLAGYVRWEFKTSSYTLIFLATNLLFTCVAEEAFFRGFLQERLATSLIRLPYGGAIAIVCSALLFGLVHAGGGAAYVALTTLLGLGSASSYALVKRIEAPIITHFTLNAVHFICFTYPHLQ